MSLAFPLRSSVGVYSQRSQTHLTLVVREQRAQGIGATTCDRSGRRKISLEVKAKEPPMERKEPWTTARGDCPSSTPRQQRPSRHLPQLRHILLSAGLLSSFADARRGDPNSTGEAPFQHPVLGFIKGPLAASLPVRGSSPSPYGLLEVGEGRTRIEGHRDSWADEGNRLPHTCAYVARMDSSGAVDQR